MNSALFDMPPVSGGFDARGGWLVNRLMAEPDLGLTNIIHAAAIVGNLGGESGLEAVNEKHPTEPGSRGGWSWAQWTGPRRRQFEAYAQTLGLPLTSDRLAYEFLVKELLGEETRSLRQLKKTTELEAAVYTFEVLFERPSDPQGGLPSRMGFAKRAMAAAVASPVISEPEPAEDALIDNVLIDSLIRALQAALALDGLYDGPLDADPGPKTIQAIQDYRAQK